MSSRIFIILPVETVICSDNGWCSDLSKSGDYGRFLCSVTQMVITEPRLRGRVGVHLRILVSVAFSSLQMCVSSVLSAYLSLATGHGDVHETTSVRDSLLGAALGGLLLLLRLNL